MKTALIALTTALTTWTAMAHIGSPNVFFDGRAGEYSLSAIIRPPASLPGVAQVTVRVMNAPARSVTVQPMIWSRAGGGAVGPVSAMRVAGETNLWSAEVWLLRPGAYNFNLGVENDHGRCQADVPVNVVPFGGEPMPFRLRFILVFFGLGLFALLIIVVAAIAREGALLADAAISARDQARGRKWGIVTAILLLAGIVAGGVRWRNLDLAYRTNAIQKPEPVDALVQAETNRVILELRQREQSFPAPPWSALVPDHGKLMHLFLVRAGEEDVFAHLHPVRMDARTFALELPALRAGDYQLYGDVTFENGMSQSLVAQVKLPEPRGSSGEAVIVTNALGEVICGSLTNLWPGSNSTNMARDMDDSWHVGDAGVGPGKSWPGGKRVARLMGGYSLLFENAGAVEAGRESALRFAAFAPDGSEVSLQNYMGMTGHAALRRSDGAVFAHLHPSGSFSMAALEVFRQSDSSAPASIPGNGSTPAANRVSFPYEFPKAGTYRLWVQVRIAGRVLTGVYDLTTRPNPGAGAQLQDSVRRWVPFRDQRTDVARGNSDLQRDKLWKMVALVPCIE